MKNQGLPLPKPGRPTVKDEERKKPRRISVSDLALANIEQLLKRLGIKTLSELVEKIGRNQLRISTYDSSPMASIPVYRRLKSLVDTPVAVFWSVLAAAARFAQQLGLEAVDNYIFTVMMRAHTIVLYVNYCFPDVLVNNSSALLRWLCFRIIQADSIRLKNNSLSPDQKTSEFIETIDENRINKYLSKISSAFEILRKASVSPDYNALMLKTIGGLSIKQVRCVFEVQGLKVNKAEISKMIKTGLSNFRNLYYSSEHSDVDFNNEKLKKHLTEKNRSDIYTYCELALHDKLDNESQDKLDKILLNTDIQASSDFWINEIDFLIGVDKELLDNKESLRQRIDNAMHDHLLSKKNEIDRKILGCRNLNDVRQALEEAANNEVGIFQEDERDIPRLTVNQLLGHTFED